MPETKEKKINSVCMKTTNNNLKVKFSPIINNDNFSDHYKNLMNGFVNAYLELFAGVAVLRPATKEERDLHCYVFETNDPKDKEHLVKKFRTEMCNELKKLFDSLLQNVFPDIQYLEDCKEYQEKYFFEDYSTKDDYIEAVKKLTDEVRANYKDIVKQCLGVMDETKEEEK